LDIGRNDLPIGAPTVANNPKYMKGDYTFLALEGGNWLMQANYAEVEKAVVEHVTEYRT
jgi:hypothetical protein